MVTRSIRLDQRTTREIAPTAAAARVGEEAVKTLTSSLSQQLVFSSTDCSTNLHRNPGGRLNGQLHREWMAGATPPRPSGGRSSSGSQVLKVSLRLAQPKNSDLARVRRQYPVIRLAEEPASCDSTESTGT